MMIPAATKGSKTASQAIGRAKFTVQPMPNRFSMKSAGSFGLK
nr:hypothetical protein [Bacillus aerolatus]